MEDQKLENLQRATLLRRVPPFSAAFGRTPHPGNLTLHGDYGTWKATGGNGNDLTLEAPLPNGWELVLHIGHKTPKEWLAVFKNRQLREIYYRSPLGKRGEPSNGWAGPVPSEVFDSTVPVLMKALRAYVDSTGLQI